LPLRALCVDNVSAFYILRMTCAQYAARNFYSLLQLSAALDFVSSSNATLSML
jgi:hypothetical protein